MSEYQLPKVAHRNNQQKALGYLNSGREGLQRALFWVPPDHPAYQQIEALIEEVNTIEDCLPR